MELLSLPWQQQLGSAIIRVGFCSCSAIVGFHMIINICNGRTRPTTQWLVLGNCMPKLTFLALWSCHLPLSTVRWPQLWWHFRTHRCCLRNEIYWAYGFYEILKTIRRVEFDCATRLSLEIYTHVRESARLCRCWRLFRVVIIHADTAKPTDHNHALLAVRREAAAKGMVSNAMRLATAECARP